MNCLASVKSPSRTYNTVLRKDQNYTVESDSICPESSHQPSYDEFVTVDIDLLNDFCRIKKHCDFSVKVNFDFEKMTWMRENGSSIDDFVWIDSQYPQYNDIVVFYLDGRQKALFQAETSTRTKNWSYQNQELNNFDNRTRHYFCVGDQISQQNLKNGTYKEATEKCSRILTLKVCNNDSLNYHLNGMLN